MGVRVCGTCHRAEKTGNQFGIWQKSKHAGAYKVLTMAKANEIARARGLKRPAAESPECLECHAITAHQGQTEGTPDTKEGIHCEVCHGPGSGYRTLALMKDRPKAIAAGLIAYKDNAAIEAKCRTCHNDRSPTFKGFKFPECWAEIKHPVPKKT
jgi:hypothetical protein